MKKTRATAARVIALALLTVSFAGGAFAQNLPANSADSGRRAVVAIDQATINNNINNAVNIGNNATNIANYANSRVDGAWNYANTAYNEARGARQAADSAAGTANWLVYGSVAGTFYFSHWGGDTGSGLCLRGYPGPDGKADCPAGTGPYYIFRGQNSPGNGE